MSNLITLQDYKQAKQLSKTDDDEKLGFIIRGVSQLIKTYCGNSFVDYATTDKTEYFSFEYGLSYVQTTESPLISVTSVEERLSETSDYQLLIADSDYQTDTEADLIFRIGRKFPAGVRSVKVVYSAGYEETPLDLKLATIDMVHYYHKDEYKQSRSLGGASIQNVTASAVDNIPGFPDHIRRVLDMYRHLS